MTRFIDADKLIWQVQDSDKYGTIAKQLFISLLQNSETADVAPIIHAHWVPCNILGFYYCSNCGGAAASIVEWEQKYCFHCGAKMDEEVDNA